MRMHLLSSLLLLGAAAPAAAGVRLPDGARPVRQAVELTLRPEADTFEGRISIDVELARAHDRLWLNALELTVREASVRVGEATLPAKAEVADADHITLDAGRPLGPGRVTVSLTYAGKVSSDSSSGIFRQREEATVIASSPIGRSLDVYAEAAGGVA